jgi:hypothetical protein
MPGARRTHSLVCKYESTRGSRYGYAEHHGIPCATVLTAYFGLSQVTGLSCHLHPRDARDINCLMSGHHHEFDASVGASGPHDFAVRKPAARPRSKRFGDLRPSQPAFNVRDDRETPLL